MLKSLLLSTASIVFARGGLSQTMDLQLYRAPTENNPVTFWNARSLELNSLDHSIAAADAVAPGPCASSRALGVIHAVIADAVSYAYPAPFKAQFNKTKPSILASDPALFVGGAAYAIMLFIYDKKVFSEIILDNARRDFIGLFSDSNKEDAFKAGIQFGNAPDFRGLWNAAKIKELLTDQRYTPTFGKHDVDPWNPGQKFYGLRWGEEPPLVLDKADIAEFANKELKAAPPIDQDELDYLIAKGSRTPKSAGKFPARKSDETDIGLFWAYDGARLLGTPPVLYNQAVAIVARADNLTIPHLARLFALCNLAMADASIVAWEAKWRIALWRPVLAIQSLTDEDKWQPYGSPRSNRNRYFPTFRIATTSSLRADDAGEDTADILIGASPRAAFTAGADTAPPDPEYARAAFTPNFPSYPSGHATFGGACFKALVNARAKWTRRPNDARVSVQSGELNGSTTDNYDPLQRRKNEPMAFRRLAQLRLAGRDFDLQALTGGNDASRIYLGVHWSFDQRDGDLAGRKVGDLIFTKAYSLT
jgi:membrane-associated phospholipid phosphatase